MTSIFIPFRNAGKFLETCLTSLVAQAEQNWVAYLIDDSSTDQSSHIAVDFASGDNRFKLFRNSRRKGLAQNLFEFSHDFDSISSSEIVFHLDGDDWLPDNGVISRVSRTYGSHRTLLVTYGNFIRFRDGQLRSEGYCEQPDSFARLRELPWTTSHLKTFRYGLLRMVQRDDFLGPDSEFLVAASDMATMFPMLEMAGPDRSACFSEINYVYNQDNPHRVVNSLGSVQEVLSHYIRKRARYQTLANVSELCGGN